jgi:hypothetical protein
METLKRLKNFIFHNTHRESPRLLFNMLAAFLTTFSVAHLYSLFVPFYVFIRGYHIHHFYYGMLLLAITSIAAVVTEREDIRHGLSYIVGIGIGLIIDELGLLLNCTGEKVGLTCRYLFPNTFDVVLIISLIFVMFIFFGDKPIHWFLPKSWRESRALNKPVEHHLKKLFGKK